MILDIVEYIILEGTMPTASIGKPNMQDAGGAYPEEKKKSVAGQFTTVKYTSETYVLLGNKN